MVNPQGEAWHEAGMAGVALAHSSLKVDAKRKLGRHARSPATQSRFQPPLILLPNLGGGKTRKPRSRLRTSFA